MGHKRNNEVGVHPTRCESNDVEPTAETYSTCTASNGNVNGITPLMRRLMPTPEQQQAGAQKPRTMYPRYPEANLPQVLTPPLNAPQNILQNRLVDFAQSLNLLINKFQQLSRSFLQPNYPHM